MANYDFGYWKMGASGGILTTGDTFKLADAESMGTVYIEDDDPNMNDADAGSGYGAAGDDTRATLTQSLDNLNVGDEIGTGYRYELLGDDGSVRVAYALFSYADAPTYGFYQENYLIFDGPAPDPNVVFTVTLVDASPYIGQSYDNLAAVCICAGATIQTVSGNILIEELRVGDLVKTADHGMQPVRWIGVRKLDLIDLLVNPKLLPVCITAGALGAGLPSTDLLVSRQHRMLLSSSLEDETSEKDTTLVAAVRLTEQPGIYIDKAVTAVEYYHVLFDQHQIIYANGAPTESLLTGKCALKALTPDAYKEIVTLFPEVESTDHTPTPARTILTNKQQKALVAEHVRAAAL